jgi:hypothetical protein
MFRDWLWQRMQRDQATQLRASGLDEHQIYPFGNRLDAGFVTRPRADDFRLSRSTPVASMGSCFAREIKIRLVRGGFHYVQTENNHFAEHASCGWERVYSVANAAEILGYTASQDFDPTRVYEHDDRSWDLLRNKVVYADRAEAEVDVRRHIVASREAIEKCELFILTVGQNEVWKDIESGRFFARRPPSTLLDTANIELEQLSLEKNLDLLRLFYRRFRTINRDAKLVVTLSPVPSTATFFDANVVVRSSLNKAIIRVAIDGFLREHPEVSYFPSYEIVQTWRGNAFEPDNRHVRPNVVDAIMKSFFALYCEG